MIRKLKKVARRIIGINSIYYNADKDYVLNVSEHKRFEGKVALVTGGSGAIGRAICMRLALEGAYVVVCGRRLETTGKVVAEIKQYGCRAESAILDVTNEKAIEMAVDKIVNNHKHIDILVNCAGGSTRTKNANLHEQSIEMIDEMLTTNLRGSMLCTRAVSKKMIEQKSGKIVNISSVIGLRGKAKFSDYAASKAGIIGYTASVAIELGKYGININCVSPGYIQRGIYTDEQLPYLLKSNCMNRVGTHEDISAAVAFLASDDANFITGQNLCVDGGRSLGLHGDS